MPPSSRRLADKPLLHLILFALTAATTFGTFFLVYSSPAQTLPERALASATFATSLLLILGCHEMGHYLYARKNGVETSLPYFIPMPLIGFGTLGAVIRIRGRIPHRRALIQIGAAGPLGGLLIAIPVIAWGVYRSRWVDVPNIELPWLGGDGSLWAIARSALDGHRSAIPRTGQGAWLYGDNLLTVLLKRLLLGPTPPGKDIAANPQILAGWFGTLVTMLNLMPIGQLDGGHLTYALFGRWARRIGYTAVAAMAVLAVWVSAGWLLWLFVSGLVVGLRHPPVVDEEATVSPMETALCVGCFLALALCAIPIPIRQVTL